MWLTDLAWLKLFHTTTCMLPLSYRPILLLAVGANSAFSMGLNTLLESLKSIISFVVGVNTHAAACSTYLFVLSHAMTVRHISNCCSHA